MPYPISITKNITIDLNNGSSYQDIASDLTEALNKVGSDVEIKDNKVKIVRCTEFSSRMTTFKGDNRGEIDLNMTGQKLKMYFRIYLVEHVVVFLVTLAIGAYGAFADGFGSVWLKVAAVALIANFVFCYLFPLMALDTFIHLFTKKVQSK